LLPCRPLADRSTPGWEELAAFRREEQRRNLRPGTIDCREKVLSSLARQVGQPLSSIAPEELEEWLDSRRISASSRYLYITIVAAFYRWAAAEGLCVSNPAERLSRPRLPRLRPHPISDEDLEIALAVADDRMRCFLLLGALGGLRCLEIAALRRQDVMEAHKPPLLFVADGGTPVPLDAAQTAL
jgi:integrase/recombinase XerD